MLRMRDFWLKGSSRYHLLWVRQQLQLNRVSVEYLASFLPTKRSNSKLECQNQISCGFNEILVELLEYLA
ncbi:hypothetical protein L1987_32694 [Smallanthus sonchifolius]|uniref:Uncharacterized protein n=1 Tax=Smallanthus sonchifolius TaxID=185202 RepID=A0ACB9HNQ8_9ASTR|nr:hypothetical protein L1987_32694 [Smallanthus sonchifolius]